MSNLVESKALDKLMNALGRPADQISIGERLLPSGVLEAGDYHFF